MTRRQRQGKGGRDHHGCKPGCFICHPEKNSAAGREPTAQERRAQADLEDHLDDYLDRRRGLMQRLADLDLA